MKKFDIKDFLDSDEEIVYEGENIKNFVFSIIGVLMLFWACFKAPVDALKIVIVMEFILIPICIWDIHRFISHKFYITNKSLILKQKNIKKIDLKEISKVNFNIDYGTRIAIVELQLVLKNDQKINYWGISEESGKYIKNFLEEKIKGVNDGDNN